ncbi:hypothetical protein GCM10018793_70000 [Streptomyces sulfonofaciens]|uniref:Uncharacterized protein n=1 Tax=Streptomyces sulfonofaciens TaxID=68272 RepID=A0A919GQB0_9ACTN|nr:hypothetical protein [Streptomyces sulfonofaciens]GHH88838.1 hypothetical protein GCM10018793_70000 [Streptomyces sulfonofaciens]
METTPPKMPQLAPEQILRAADYVELVWQEQGSEEEKAALEEFSGQAPTLRTPHPTGIPQRSTTVTPRRRPENLSRHSLLGEMSVVPVHHFVGMTGHPGQPPGRVVGHTAAYLSTKAQGQKAGCRVE